MEHYVAAGYVQTDPVRLECFRARSAFLWKDLRAPLPAEQQVIFDEAAEIGIRDGIGIPLHGPRGELAGISIASSSGGTDAKASG